MGRAPPPCRSSPAAHADEREPGSVGLRMRRPVAHPDARADQAEVRSFEARAEGGRAGSWASGAGGARPAHRPSVSPAPAPAHRRSVCSGSRPGKANGDEGRGEVSPIRWRSLEPVALFRVLAASPARASRRAGQGRSSRPRCRGVCCERRGAMMRRRNSSSNSSVETAGGRASVTVRADSGAEGWCGAVSTTVSVGFPARQDGVDASGDPGQPVLQHGVGAGAGLAHAVLDVGQRAHGELQAVGQVGAVAVTQRDAAAHDVVAEVLQVASVRASVTC